MSFTKKCQFLRTEKMSRFIDIDELKKDMERKDVARQKMLAEVKGLLGKMQDFRGKHKVQPNIVFASRTKFYKIESHISGLTTGENKIDSLYGAPFRHIPELAGDKILFGYRKIYAPTGGSFLPSMKDIADAKDDFQKEGLTPTHIIFCENTYYSIANSNADALALEIITDGQMKIVSKVAKNNVMVCLLEQI